MTLTLSPVAVYAARCAAPVAGLGLWAWGNDLGLAVAPGWYLGLGALLAIANAGELRARLAAGEPATIEPARAVRNPDVWATLLTLVLVCGWLYLHTSRLGQGSPRMIASAFAALVLVAVVGFGRRTAPSNPYVSYRWRGSPAERAWRRVRERVR